MDPGATDTVFVTGGSEKDRTVVFRDNFKFTFHKDLVGGIKRWSCSGQKKYKCKAFLKTLVEEVVDSNDIHTHAASMDEKEITLIKRGIKRKSTDDLSTHPSKIVKTVMSEIPECNVNDRLLKGFKQLAYRNKRKKLPALPKSADELLSDLSITNTVRTSEGESCLLMVHKTHKGAEEDQPSACASDLPPSTDFCEVLVKTEPEEYSLAPGEPSTSGLTTEFDVVTCKNEIDECMTPEYEDPLADVVPEPEPEPVPVNDQLAADDLSYFQSLASNLNKLSLDQKMVFRIKVSNILRELVAA